MAGGRRTTHVPNRRGEGARLRADILAAAGRILETTGNDDAVTLRAVAREAGITAPAIYAHFTDREDLRFTVIADTFSELATALQAAADRHRAPARRLRAVGAAYLEFAARRPHHYRVLFERHRAAPAMASDPAGADVRTMVGADAFGVLLDATDACLQAGVAHGGPAATAATRVWIGLHGQATLRASLPWFPWPDAGALAEDVMARLAGLDG